MTRSGGSGRYTGELNHGREEPSIASLPAPQQVQEPILRVVGVGGAGVNAVNRMIEAGVAGMPTAFDDEREQIVYEMATVLAGARWVPRGLYQRAVEALGHVGITDVITLMGHYSSVAMTLAFYDVPDGATGLQR